MSILYMYTFMPIIFLIVVTVMWLLHKVKKTKFIKNKPTSEHERQKYEKWEKRIEITATVGLIVIWIFLGIPHILDVPYLVTGNLKEAMGTVTGGDAVTEEKEIDRLICIDDELSGKEVYVSCHTEGIHKGEFVVVQYLPHTERGYIVTKGEK